MTPNRSSMGGLHRGLGALVGAAALLSVLAACNTDKLLNQEAPSRVEAGSLDNPANARLIVNARRRLMPFQRAEALPQFAILDRIAREVHEVVIGRGVRESRNERVRAGVDVLRSRNHADRQQIGQRRRREFAWSERLDGIVEGSPRVANGLVYVATHGKWLYAIDPRKPAAERVARRYALEERPTGTPGLSPDGAVIYVASARRSRRRI